ncbi:exported protein of unknown function [Beijerinckiaceae bacterium RH AL1]|nr:exported protein of unknown function [Beijerinckiaceae bacterium RH CH11]VVB49329.1 exported protein of unknown function [Beijerinckiaceae bacterium RH AL8]VVC56804.1 exported protein of unknown function [Beijerinckiaceae bacterium RH AL1]
MFRLAPVFALVLAPASACALESYPTRSPAAIVSAMAHEEVDPGTSEQKHKAYRRAYFSKALQAYEKQMKPDDWQDFDADDFTGTQDLSGFTVKSVTPTKRGDDIKIDVAYGNDDNKDEHGKPYPPFHVGYVMVQDREGAWKIDDMLYDKIENVTPERSFRAMYAHP